MLFSSKRKISSQQVCDAFSVSKDAVKTKLAELSDVSYRAESSFREASAISKEVVEQLTSSNKKRKKPVAS